MKRLRATERRNGSRPLCERRAGRLRVAGTHAATVCAEENDLVPPSGLHVVMMNPRTEMCRDPGMRAHPFDLAAKLSRSVKVWKWTGAKAGAGLLLQAVAQFFVFEGQHPTAGVVEDDEFLRPQR